MESLLFLSAAIISLNKAILGDLCKEVTVPTGPEPTIEPRTDRDDWIIPTPNGLQPGDVVTFSFRSSTTSPSGDGDYHFLYVDTGYPDLFILQMGLEYGEVEVKAGDWSKTHHCLDYAFVAGEVATFRFSVSSEAVLFHLMPGMAPFRLPLTELPEGLGLGDVQKLELHVQYKNSPEPEVIEYSLARGIFAAGFSLSGNAFVSDDNGAIFEVPDDWELAAPSSDTDGDCLVALPQLRLFDAFHCSQAAHLPKCEIEEATTTAPITRTTTTPAASTTTSLAQTSTEKTSIDPTSSSAPVSTTTEAAATSTTSSAITTSGMGPIVYREPRCISRFRFTRKEFDRRAMHSREVPSLGACGRLCHEVEGCEGITFDLNSKSCQLFRAGPEAANTPTHPGLLSSSRMCETMS